MDFKQLGKIVIAVLSVVGVAGLIYMLFIDGNVRFGSGIALTHDFGRLNAPRIFLMMWETFWLTSIGLFFIYLVKRATTEKSHEEIEQLENFEPKLFKIIITGLIIAAVLTLVLPIFVGENTLVQYNQNDEGTEITVEAFAFGFVMNGSNCGVDLDPANVVAEDSCITLNMGERYIFLLTSSDTTHGFTIYDDHMRLLTQAQIVPGHETRVAFTFEEGGLYSIRCAEYCGAGHHSMLAAFTVGGPNA